MPRPTFLLLFATRHGQSRKIAEHLARRLTTDGVACEVRNAADVRGDADLDLRRYCGAILVASVHGGRHEREMVAFAQAHRSALLDMPSAFLSVSLSQATAGDAARPVKARQRAERHVNDVLDEFVAASGWLPARMLPVAGALRYTEYGFFLRQLMRLIARSTGAATDLSRDHEYTDWAALDRFAAEFARVALGAPASRPAEARGAA